MDNGKDAPTDGRTCIEPAVLVAPPGETRIESGAAKTHHLTEAHAVALAALARAGDRAAEATFLAALEPMAFEAAVYARRRRPKLPPWIDLDDILSAAREGIWMAIADFDGRGSFLGYARQRAAWRIHDVIDTRTVRRSAREVRGGNTLSDFGVTAVYRHALEHEDDEAEMRCKAALKPLNRLQRSLLESVHGLNGRPARDLEYLAKRHKTTRQGVGKMLARALRRAGAAVPA